MFRKNYLIFVLMLAAILIGSSAVFAQSATIAGKVQLENDGKKTPAPNVLVEAYRTDTKTVEPISAKTDEKGEFKIENLPSGKEFALAVSGENFEASVVTDVKSGATNVEVTVKSGNGSQPSAEQVRQVLLSAGKLKLSAEETAEEEKARKNTEEKNSKTEESNAAIRRLNGEGEKAYKDENYDLAIAKFEEGYQVNPTFLGSAPGFLGVKAIVLRQRALKNYNAGVASADAAIKVANYEKASKDFSDGIDTYHKSWMLLKNATDAQKSEVKNFNENKIQTLSGARDLIFYSIVTGNADPEKTDKVKELLEAYMNFESDKKKKAEANSTLADYYRLTLNYDTAIAMYRKVLSASPDEPGALFGLGLALYTAAYKDDGSIEKAKLQEAANLLKRFVDVAPAEPKNFIKDAQETLDTLKGGENITPKKN